MASMMDMPREVHLEQIFHMFANLRKKYNSSMVFDLIEPNIDKSRIVPEDWSYISYGECKE